MASRIFEVTHGRMLIEQIKQYREEYKRLYPDRVAATIDFKPVEKHDIFGNIIHEYATLDNVVQEQEKKNYQKQMDSWVFYRLLSDGEDFSNLVAIMGNPGDMMPCDGDLHQCELFCPEYGKCKYLPNFSPKDLKEELEKPAAAGQSVSEKPKRRRRKKK